MAGRRNRWPAALAASLLVIAACGCLGTPKIEDRWTRIDLVSSTVAPYQAVPAGGSQPVAVSARVTFRSILTGFAVVDLRSSATLSGGDVVLDPAGPRLRMAQDIDRILAQSVSVGRATRAVAGWDHLVQQIDLSFVGAVPATVDSAGSSGGLFLVCYLGAGEEMERADGSDTLIVTPYGSETYRVLPVGMKLVLAPPVAQ